MKKTIVLLLVLAVALSVASCGTKNNPDAEEPPVNAGDVNTDDTEQQTEEEKKAEEEAQKKAEEEEAQKKAEEEEAQKKAEEEAQKKAEEEEAQKKAEEEAQKKAEEEEAQKKAEEEAQKKAEEDARKAEEEARRKAEEEAQKAEEEARRKAEEEAQKAEEEANGQNGEDANEQDGQDDQPSLPPGGGIIVPGFGGVGGGDDGGDTDAETPALGDASGLVSDLETIADGNTGEMSQETYALTGDDYWRVTNWFPGITVPDGTKFAANTPMMGSIAHMVLLIEVPDGTNADDFASELSSHANPRWQICVAAESTQYAVSGSRILFVMSTAEIADAVIAAFNG